MRSWEAHVEGAVEHGPDKGERHARADGEAVIQGGHLKLCFIFWNLDLSNLDLIWNLIWCAFLFHGFSKWSINVNSDIIWKLQIKLHLLLGRDAEEDCRYPDSRHHYNGHTLGGRGNTKIGEQPPPQPYIQPPAETGQTETMNENSETCETIYRSSEAAINPKVNHLS